MGIIRLILITAALIWLAMYYYGRDDGLPEARIGRAPDPEPAMSPIEETATADDTAVGGIERGARTADALEAAVDEAAQSAASDSGPEPEIVTIPEPEPVIPPEPEPVATPESEPETAPDTATEAVLYVSGERVNVRAGPSTDFAVITALVRGAPVVDIGPAGGSWREIRLDTGETGYMSADFLSSDPQ
jgi:hypothetical protein